MNTMNLPVRLTTDELLLRSDELATKIRDAADIEREMKAAAAKSKTELGAIETQIAHLARVVREKKELRDVEVFEVKNWERVAMETYRRDTGEFVASRALTVYEQNETLFPREKEPPAEPVADAAPEATEPAQEATAEPPEPAIPPVEETAQAAPATTEEAAPSKPAVT